MTRIKVFDAEAERIKKIAEEKNVYDAEVIEALFDAIEDNGIDIYAYL